MSTNFGVRGNLRPLSLNAVNAAGDLVYGNIADAGPSTETRALQSVRIDAVADVLRRMAVHDADLAEIYARRLGLCGLPAETLSGIGRSLGMTASVVQLRYKRAAALFERLVQFHPHVAYLRAA